MAALTGCTGSGPDVLRVSAAASLTDAFQQLVVAYEVDNPGIDVELNLGGSATLVEQIVRGAPVDVLATADPTTMARAVQGGVVGEPVAFATNELRVAWPADGPDRDVASLGERGLLVGLCAPPVPCGAAARRALDAAGVTPAPDTEDGDVRTLLSRLVAGELDVGVVYATDVVAADGAVGAAPLPGGTTELVIAAATTAPTTAEDFIAFITSDTSAGILRDHGFEVAS